MTDPPAPPAKSRQLLLSASRGEPAPPRRLALEPGSTVGRFVITRELGRGGMGVVLAAHDPRMGREVAVKLIFSHTYTTQQLKRFEREAQATARLRHGSIVSVHEFGRHAGHPYLVMDLVQGESLEQLVAQGRISPRRVAEVVVQVARGLGYAHSQGIVHRDVKPENVLVDEEGRGFLTDFGLARDDLQGESLTRSGQIVGTPLYLNPEQAQGLPALPQSDVFSLGSLLYFSLTGSYPFSAESFLGLLHQITHEAPLRPRRLNPALHPALEAIVLRCLEKSPARRYPTADDLADDLALYLSTGEAGRTGRARRLALPLAAGVLGLAGLTLLAWAVRPIQLPAPRAARSADGAAQVPVQGAEIPASAEPGGEHAAEAEGQSPAGIAVTDSKVAQLIDPHEVGSPWLASTEESDRLLEEERAHLVKSLRKGGDALLRAGDYQGAADAFTRWLAVVPQDDHAQRAEVLRRLSRAARQLEEHVLALDYAEQALELDPADPEGFEVRARARWSGGDLQGAEQDLSTWLTRDPPQGEEQEAVLLDRARLRLALGRPRATVADCTRLLGSDPEHVDARLLRSEALAAMGLHEAAQRDLERWEVLSERGD